MSIPQTKDKARNMLINAGVRLTQQRQAVLQALIEASEPISQEQIAERITGSAPNKVTIYRVLECLIEKNIVHNAFTRDRTAFYELANNCTHTQCHPHFTCISCRKTLCVKDAHIPIAKIADKGFKIKLQKVELQGLCPECSR